MLFPHTKATPVPAQRVVTGQLLGKAQYGAGQRASLAAGWVSGKLNVKIKPTVKAAVVIFGVSQPLISAALADLGAPARKGNRKAIAKTANGNGKAAKTANGNGNGHGHNGNGGGGDFVVRDQLPFIPDANDIWLSMSDDEREDFVRDHATSIWSALDRITVA
jgi:hypothetical protein